MQVPFGLNCVSDSDTAPAIAHGKTCVCLQSLRASFPRLCMALSESILLRASTDDTCGGWAEREKATPHLLIKMASYDLWKVGGNLLCCFFWKCSSNISTTKSRHFICKGHKNFLPSPVNSSDLTLLARTKVSSVSSCRALARKPLSCPSQCLPAKSLDMGKLNCTFIRIAP